MTAMKFLAMRYRIKCFTKLNLMMLLAVLGDQAVAQGLGAERILGLKEASKTVFAFKARAASQSPLAPFQETLTQLRQMIDTELKTPLIVAAEPGISGQQEASRPRGRSPEKSTERELAFRGKQQAFDEKRTRLNDIKAQYAGKRESNDHGLVESAATHLEEVSLEFKSAIEDTPEKKIERLVALRERLKARSDVSIEDEVTSSRLQPSISTRLAHRAFENVAK